MTEILPTMASVCLFCDQIITDEFLHSHLSEHFDCLPYRCDHPECEKRFSDEKQIDIHFRYKHNGVKFMTVFSNNAIEARLSLLVDKCEYFLKNINSNDGVLQKLEKIASTFVTTMATLNGGNHDNGIVDSPINLCKLRLTLNGCDFDENTIEQENNILDYDEEFDDVLQLESSEDEIAEAANQSELNDGKEENEKASEDIRTQPSEDLNNNVFITPDSKSLIITINRSDDGERLKKIVESTPLNCKDKINVNPVQFDNDYQGEDNFWFIDKKSPRKRVVYFEDIGKNVKKQSSSRVLPLPEENCFLYDRTTEYVPDEYGLFRERSASPSGQNVTSIIHVRNLIRPLTVKKLQELLSKFGEFNNEDFWIDEKKYHCYVKYHNMEDAAMARSRLHNAIWPNWDSNTLHVDYVTQNEFDCVVYGEGSSTANNESFMLSGINEKLSSLDDEFNMTKTLPPIYWLPLTDAEVAEKETKLKRRILENNELLKKVKEKEEFIRRELRHRSQYRRY